MGSISIAIAYSGWLSVRSLAKGSAGPLAAYRVLPSLSTSHSSHRYYVLLCLTFDLSWSPEEKGAEEGSMENGAQQEAEE